jgi:hypothetical protein
VSAAATCLALAQAAAGAEAPPGLARRQTLELKELIADWHLVDADGDGAAELLTIDRAGRVSVRRSGPSGTFPEAPLGGFALPHPEHTLLALAPAGAGLELVLVDPDGARRRGLSGPDWERETPLAASAQNRLRVGRPTFAPLIQDANGDGRFDLVVPDARGADLWLAVATEAGGEELRRAARVPLRASHSAYADAELLSDVLTEELVVPRLDTEDVNGDGRADLVVVEGERQSWHLQDQDGSFPIKPTVEVDLAIFRDTTPEASVAPGHTLVLGDDASMSSSDLNADGIPDYVIAHRRKVWVFLGGAAGPQFTEPATILKTAEDVTTLLLLDLDQDDLPDLLIVKLVVPSLASILVGMVRSFDVEITALGYRNEGGRSFSKTPTDRGTVVLRLPPLLELLKRPEDVLERLEEVGRKYRSAASGDFDGDGHEDVALLSEDGSRLELWRAPADAPEEVEGEGAAWIRKLLFSQEDPIFDIDRVIDLIGGYAEQRTRRLTGDRAPDAALAIAKGALPLVAALPADVDGDGRVELVLGYGGADGRTVLEVVELR